MRPPDKRKPGRGGPGLRRVDLADKLIGPRDKSKQPNIQANPLTWFAAAFFRHGRLKLRAFI